jgi:hypothetical protein
MSDRPKEKYGIKIREKPDSAAYEIALVVELLL